LKPSPDGTNSSLPDSFLRFQRNLEFIDHLTGMDRLEMAEKEVKRLLNDDPNQPEYILRYAWVLMRLGRQGEAEKVLRELVAMAPDLMQARHVLALVLGRTRPREAEEWYLSVLHEYPFHRQALIDYSRLLQSIGQPSKAQALLKHVLRLDPEHTEAQVGLAAHMLDERKHEEAAELIETALSNAPEDSMAHYLKAIQAYNESRFLDAYKDAREAVRQNPKFRDAEILMHNADRRGRGLGRLLLCFEGWRGTVGIVTFPLLVSALAATNDASKEVATGMIWAAIVAAWLVRMVLRWYVKYCTRRWPRQPDGTISPNPID
jgi:tetratricopeptide (TPR) repeat protein